MNFIQAVRPRRLWVVALLVTTLLALLWSRTSAAPLPAQPAQAAAADWLIMVYLDADDNSLEEDMLIDMQEMEVVGSSENVHIVVQVDRFVGAYDGMEDFTSARRYYVTQDDDPTEIGSEMVEDLGEVTMGDGGTLEEFIVWAVENYPAQKTMLIMSDHGMGWPGGFGDPDPDVLGADDILMREWFDQDSMWLMEIDRTLASSLKAAGLKQFDVVGFDACLMAQLEVFTALAPYAKYAVASEETEPGVGWAYAAWMTELTENPTWTGADLSKSIVRTYIDDDLRPYWDADFRGEMEPEQLAPVLFNDATLTAVDLSAIPALNTALDGFTAALTGIDQNGVAKARTYAQAYESVFGEEGEDGSKWPSPYIDLGHFAQLVMKGNSDASLQTAGKALQAALKKAVILERHGVGRKGSQGIAIYFPVKSMVQTEDNLGYTTVAARFTETTQWDEFLGFHASGGVTQSFNKPKADPVAVAREALSEELLEEDIDYLFELIAQLIDEEYTPEEMIPILVDEVGYPQEVADYMLENGLLAPSPASRSASTARAFAKPVKVGPIKLSAELAEPDAPVNISTEITGDRLAYVYSFIGRFLPKDDVLIIEDQDYIFADESQDVGGVTVPVWPADGFIVDFDWEPTVYAISDGESSLRVLFAPESYGDSPTYAVNGVYHFKDGSPDKYAKLLFREGELVQIFGFTGAGTDGKGAPREIRSTPGDTITLIEEGLNLADDAQGSYNREIGDLTFGDTPFFIEETPAPSGNYVVGIIAEDLDGQTYEQYEGLFVINPDAVAEDGFAPYANDELAFALLYPETWTVDESDPEAISFVSDDEAAFITVEQLSYPDADSLLAASEQALQDAVESLGEEADLADLEFGEAQDYVLGSYDARLIDFFATLDDIPLLGTVVASTPTEGVTHVVLAVAQDDIYTDTAPLFDAVFFSFDVLLSGIDRGVAGAAPPVVDEVLFEDDFSDPESGLFQDEVAQEWGRGYYDAKTKQYVYALTPDPGAIFDYYVDVELPDSFVYQAVTSFTGSADNLYGLIFQVLDEEQFYLFRVSGDGYFIVDKSTADGLETLVDWTIGDAISTEEGGENVLTVVGNGGDYALYVNDQWVGSFSDNSYTAGTVGIVADNFDAKTGTTFTFDDLVVG
ncbi:MAG: hypothetical protein KBG20_07995, partial [Caldilineaceae bacterium]|nr:hypothetical protein [Caldilineaceae bacterium]